MMMDKAYLFGIGMFVFLLGVGLLGLYTFGPMTIIFLVLILVLFALSTAATPKKEP